MLKQTGFLVALLSGMLGGMAAEPVVAALPAKKAVVYVIPVRDEINQPTFYILRRGLKEAIEQKADAVVLDMNTPGGAGSVAFDMMEALDKFPGLTITFVDKEAMSAGAFIAAATQEIWFAPKSVIGAAAAVTAEGQDIPETMRLKINSFLRAKIRAVSEGKGYRGQVIEAMIDKDYELKIGDKVIKPKGELLSRTATEAMEKYGEPPQALLGAGIEKDLDALLAAKYGAGNYVITRFQVTWSEKLAQYLTAFSSVLMGLGLLALFIEFKMPSHGGFAVVGVILLGVVFFGHYIAGLSGHEPLLVFAVGLLLVALEVFFFPGVAVVAVLGLVLMLGSLVWAMADLWPGQPLAVAWSADTFAAPLQNLGLGLALAVALGAALLRFLPRRWLWDRLVVGTTIGGSAQVAGGAPGGAAEVDALIGRRGVAVTALRPSGQIEVAGRRFEAKVEVGSIDAGEAIVVQGRTDFGLIVERAAL